MYHVESKYRLTRKPHICSECNKIIAPKSMAYWFKSVVFKESDVGRNCQNEGYVCVECDKKTFDRLRQVLGEVRKNENYTGSERKYYSRVAQYYGKGEK